MKIAFVGKGGSGKTTLASLFAREVHALGYPVLAVDADINQHLGAALGMDGGEAAEVPALGLGVAVLKDYLRGSNPRIASAEAMTKTTPPGAGSRLLRVVEDNPIYTQFQRRAGDVRLMATGPFDDADLGTTCYHAKTGAVELLLNHLLDGAGEYVVVDMTAGADAFASGLSTRFDLTVIVAEPTRKAVDVYRQYRGYAAEFGVRLGVAGNKVVDEYDRAFLRDEVGDDLLACFGHSAYVRQAERGHRGTVGELEEPNRSSLAALQAVLDRIDKDWDAYYRQAAEFHRRAARAAGDATRESELLAQIDDAFSPASTPPLAS